MSEMTVRRPFTELNLRYQLRLDPHAVFHLLPCQCPHGALLLRKVNERTGINLQPFEALKHFLAGVRDKAIADLRIIVKFTVLVVTEDDGVKRVVWNVPAYDELLPFVDSVFQPHATSLSRFI